jgi:hypothetical protein
MISAAVLGLQLLLNSGPEMSPAGTPGAGHQTAAQATAPSQKPPPAQTPPQLPINFSKIKLAVNTPATLKLVDQSGFRFYSETVRPAPKFSDMVGSFDLFNGPVPHSGMTHAEFLKMSRPKEMYSSAGFTPGDVIRWGILAYTERKGWELIRYSIKQLAEAKTEAERKQIRLQIERELAALRGETIK